MAKKRTHKDKDIGCEVISRRDSDKRRVDKNAPIPGYSNPAVPPGIGMQYSTPRTQFEEPGGGVFEEPQVGGLNTPSQTEGRVPNMAGMNTPAQKRTSEFSKGTGSHIIS